MTMFFIFLIVKWRRSRDLSISLNCADLENELQDELLEKLADALFGQTENISERERKNRWDALRDCLDLIKALRDPFTDDNFD